MNVFLKPGGDDLLVRDPQTLAPLPVAGEWKTMSPFWARRLRDGDVIDATAEAIAAPVKSPAKSRAVEPAKPD